MQRLKIEIIQCLKRGISEIKNRTDYAAFLNLAFFYLYFRFSVFSIFGFLDILHFPFSVPLSVICFAEDKVDGMEQGGLLKSPTKSLMEKIHTVLQARSFKIKNID